MNWNVYIIKEGYVLKIVVLEDFLLEIGDKLVDWNGRCETHVGEAGQVRPRRSDSDKEAHHPLHGKGASWSGD